MKKILLSASFLLITGYMFATDLISGQTYRLSLGEKVLSVKDGSLANNSDVVSWTETNVNAQRWVLVSGEGKGYQWMNAYTGQYLACRGNVISGAQICQMISGESAATWEIVPVKNQADLYYITQSGLFLEVADVDSDGGSVRLSTKKSGTLAERQMWKLEVVEAQPNYLTEATRDAMMEGWKKNYYNDSQGRLGEGGFWGDAEMFEVVLDAYEVTGDIQYKTMFDKLHADFIARQGNNWESNDFNDDIAWIVIASVRGYLMTGKQSYLDVAKSNFDMMYERAAVLPHDMLIWNASENPYGTNSCINGPAGVAACYLAIATGDESYYEKARKTYAAQREYLYKPSTGQVYDSFTWQKGVPSNYNTWASTYNQGTFLGTAVMLYNHYGDEQYKEDAQMIMKYTRKQMCNEFGVIKVCQGVVDDQGKLVGDLPGFKGILMRYVRRFMVDLYQPDCAEWMAINAFQAYNNRNSDGVSCTAWLTKTVEEYTTYVPFTNYNKDPFGPSTAVSAAFNSYIGDKTVRKDAFRGIEAENFDYLKGIYTLSVDGVDSPVMGGDNMAAAAYTGYHNVDFGPYYAKSLEFRVLPQRPNSKIEVYLDSPDGKLLGTVTLPNEQEWQTVALELLKPLDGMRNIYLKYTRGTGAAKLQLDNFQFKQEGYTSQDITDNGGTLTTSVEVSTKLPGVGAVIDNQVTTALVGTVSGDAWIQYQSPYPVVLKGYLLVAAEGTQEGDPKSWKLQASEDGKRWIDVDTQNNQTFETRYQKKQYDTSVVEAYTYFRLFVSDRQGNGDRFQLAEWQLFGTALADNCITTDGGMISAQYSDGIEKLIDKDVISTYRTNTSDFWVEYEAEAAYTPLFYSITTADTPESDPKSWILYASKDGNTWIKMDQRTGQLFPYRGATYTYSFTTSPSTIDSEYTYFKLHVTENNGASDTRLAEWQLTGRYVSQTFYNDITANGGELTSSLNEAINSETLKRLTDNDGNTFYTFGGDVAPWIEYKSSIEVKLKSFSIVSADEPDKDPVMIKVEYKNEGDARFKRAFRGEVAFTKRNERVYVSCPRVVSGQCFRLTIETVSGEGNEAKIAEFELYGNGILADDLTSVATITPQYESENPEETADKLIDKDVDSKYCGPFSSLSAWICCEVPEPVKVNMYSLTSGNDNEGRDPRSWVLEASNDGVDWVTIDSRSNQSFSDRQITQYYTCNQEGQSYSDFRLRVTENHGEGMLQLSEWQLFVDLSVGIESETAIEAFVDIRVINNRLYIDVPETAQVQVCDLTGMLIHDEKIQSGVSYIPMANLNGGMYIVRIQLSNRTISRKFIK